MTQRDDSDSPKRDLAVRVSTCCGAVLTIGGGGTTHYYICSKCTRPCESMPRDGRTR